MKKILILSPDPLKADLAGPVIRYLEIARALSARFDVTLAIPNDDPVSGFPFKIAHQKRDKLLAFASEFHVVFMPGHLMSNFHFLRKIPGSLVLDLYDPILFEELEHWAHLDIQDQNNICWNWVERLNREIQAGDHFVCASEAQRNLWLGMLMGSGRVNPHVFNKDKTLRSLIDILPFGLPAEPPKKTKPVIKGVYPGIEKTDKVILWGGGVYDWLDPLTAVQAMTLVRNQRKDIKLFFMGMRHPNPSAHMKVIKKTFDLSDALGLTGKSVMFFDWVSYTERADYLLESDVGICLHHNSIETDFSFRTRILDYIWAELPMIVTTGGALSEVVESQQLGITVSYNDPEALAKKILAMFNGGLSLEKFRQNIRTHQNEYTWERALAAFMRFCEAPGKKIDSASFHVKWPFKIFFYYITRFRMIRVTEGTYFLIKRVFGFAGRKLKKIISPLNFFRG